MIWLVLIIGIGVIILLLRRGLGPSLTPDQTMQYAAFGARDNFELAAKNIAYCYEALKDARPGLTDQDYWVGAYRMATERLVTCGLTSEGSREFAIGHIAMRPYNHNYYDIAVDVIAYEMILTAPHLSEQTVTAEVHSRRARIVDAIRVGQREYHTPSAISVQAKALATEYAEQHHNGKR